MLGFRGCRLGIVHPAITRMQAQAILEAAAQVAAEEAAKPKDAKDRSPPPKAKIMIPLVGCAAELRAQIGVVQQAARDVFDGDDSKLPRVEFEVGTMIVSVEVFCFRFFFHFFSFPRRKRLRQQKEKKNLSNHIHAHASPPPLPKPPPLPPPKKKTQELPRAALAAASLAAPGLATFFSVGSNDLTQTTLGFSRDDAEARFLPAYLSKGILPADPFATIDKEGVGELIKIALERGRGANPELEVGVCGEHGGDPQSIAFFDSCGVSYVSCSPLRIPLARLAAAQAAISRRRKGGDHCQD